MDERASSISTRPDTDKLRERPGARVLVIGGGMNGIATFRDLALQGVDVALVERNDYASGASAASSHMIHGGIRYLENGELRLVKESVQERNRLLKLAPHYVRPLETTIPIFATFSGVLSAPLKLITHRQSGRPKERGALLIKVGLMIYDTFSRAGGSVPRHRMVGRTKALAELPKLNRDLKYAATYFDASVHEPERLALDLLDDALSQGRHARSANYTAVVGVTDDGVILEDQLSGDRFTFAADVVVNATGPWTDLTNASLGKPTGFMGGTKGSHIVLDHPELLEACAGREIFFEHSDGRIVLIYPVNDRVLVGTTDIAVDISDSIAISDAEVDYFIELVSHVFPKIVINRSQIVHTFSGVRPLPREEDVHPGFISRDYRIERALLAGRLPALSLVGGKLTTFRAVSEHLTDEVLTELGIKRLQSTANLAIGGGRGFPKATRDRRDWVNERRGSVPAERAEALLNRYGTRAETVIRHILLADDRPLETAPDYSTAEIRYLCEHEHVVHLVDLILRRTSLAFTGRVSTELLDELSQIAARALGWPEDRRSAEVRLAEDVMRRKHPIPRKHSRKNPGVLHVLSSNFDAWGG